MHRVRLARAVPLAASLIIGAAVTCMIAVSAAAPTAPLVAQAATAPPTASAVATVPAPSSAVSTAPAASAPSGAVSVPSIAVPTTDTGSAVPPPSIPPTFPPVDTSSGPSQQMVIETIIGIIAAAAIVAVAGVGLIRMIATAGR